MVNTKILSATDYNGQKIVNGSSTNSSNILFTYTGSSNIQNATIEKFICSLDGSHSVSSAFTCETSPSGYSDLPSGNYTFRVKAVDSNGNTGTDAKFAWNILNSTSGSSSNGPPQPVVNHGPVANDQLVKISNTANTNNNNNSIKLTATDQDPFSKLLTFSLVTNPSQGTLSNFNSSSGSLVYTPNTGFTGVDSFKFKANDGYLDSNNANVSIKVGNRAPVAVNGSSIITAHRNTPLNILLNATDPDLPIDHLTYSILSNPTSGVISNFNSSRGSLTYTPNQNYVGADKFTFKVNDGTIDSNNIATVSLNVTAASTSCYH